MSSNETFKIRPAGRHILTVGRDLIQDSYAAVVEIVKNSYDADAHEVTIEFKASPELSGYSVVISDDGHGMDRSTVIEKWMVPSTPDKLERRQSPGGRVMQGRKGVGRYAASILGSDLLLETVSGNQKTTLVIDWRTFESAKFLDEVEILIETEAVEESSGTTLTITGDSHMLEEWSQNQFDKLRFELKKLISPVSGEDFDAADFLINLKISGFASVHEIDEYIEPYPLFQFFDYRINGKIGSDGKGNLTYSHQKVRGAVPEHIFIDLETPTGCGTLVFDIRVYDREAEAIETLIGRGLKDEAGNYVGKLQARRLLNEYNGIGVYRNGFRIRPLGDADFDWLKLNGQRVQNPSLRIGSNQTIGYVQIEAEEKSGLVEKSARDGLRENLAYARLKEITKTVIGNLETRRFEFRRRAGLSKSPIKVEKELRSLFSFESMKTNIRARLTKRGIATETVDEIVAIIVSEEEEKSKAVDDIRKTVAVYQGQATLGKIINVILHEGRRPLNYFKNQIPNLDFQLRTYTEKNELENLQMFLKIANGIGQNAENFVELFSRLDPLAAGKRPKRRPLPLISVIKDAAAIFDREMKSQGVSLDVRGPTDFRLDCWQQDIAAIFTNLIENSLFWMEEKKVVERNILICVKVDTTSLLCVDYRDSGPGIDSDLIEDGVIFEPQFSTKPNGTGLGLAIAGEAATRNGLELRALLSDQGAWFRLQLLEEEWDSD